MEYICVNFIQTKWFQQNNRPPKTRITLSFPADSFCNLLYQESTNFG